MVFGAHILLYSADADADRAFFRDVLQFPAVDAGQGWLIFGLPPAEIGFHPTADGAPAGAGADRAINSSFNLMVKDIHAYVKELSGRGVKCGPVSEEPWGIATGITLPSGAEIGLYQPRHAIAIKSP